MKRTKRLLGLLLSVFMLATMIPVTMQTAIAAPSSVTDILLPSARA